MRCVPETDSPRARAIEESEHHSNSDNSIGFPDNTSQPEESPEVGPVLENPDFSNPSSPPYSPDSMTLRDFPFSAPYIVQEEGQPSVPENRQIDFPEPDVEFPFGNRVNTPR